jgi:hypothetical protein
MRKVLLFLVVMALAPAQNLDWKLGTLQTRAEAGFNLRDSRDGAQPSVGGGLDIGLNRYLAATTNYTWNLDYASSSGGFRARSSLHDLMGGLRFHAANQTRLTPFVAGLGGVVVVTANASYNKHRLYRDSLAQPAAGLGAGLELRIGRGWSALVEARAIRPREMYWFGSVGFGFACRPGRHKEPWGF